MTFQQTPLVVLRRGRVDLEHGDGQRPKVLTAGVKSRAKDHNLGNAGCCRRTQLVVGDPPPQHDVRVQAGAPSVEQSQAPPRDGR